jgi:asparagine synthase (glutamine-hydrolysing)
MRAFLAISGVPHAVNGLRGRIPHALAGLADEQTSVERVDAGADGWVAFAGTGPEDLLGVPGGAFTVRLSRLARTREADVSTADLAGMLGAALDGAALDGAGIGGVGGALAALLPPFAAAHRERPGGPVVVAGDWLGFRQLYWWRGAGVAAVGTSARALAALAGAGLDPAGLGAQAMIGWQVADATIFSGVRALPPATVATLERGSLVLRRYADPPARPQRAPALDDAVEEMAAVLVAWQTGYLAAHPDTVLQLTGGHDSRILLGAVPEKLRAGLRALTLGDAASRDVRIAAQLSNRYRLRHQVYRLEEQAWPSPAEAHELALASARALECLASPLALAPLLLAESHLEQGHRLSGLGGEVARGFYYTGQPAGAVTSPRLVDRLARWRLFSNEAVEAAALDRDFLAMARETTLATLRTLFAAGDWLRATDEFYLYHRMHRWAGVHGTVAAVRRYSVNPMFDRRFIELALGVAPADKRDSLLLARLMTRLDRELAAIPLDSGLVPSRLATGSAVARVGSATLTARKAVRKVRQRLTRGRRPQLGADHTAALVLAHWRAEPEACQPLRGLEVVNREWLDGLLAGAHTAQPTTVAFLVNLLAATQRS